MEALRCGEPTYPETYGTLVGERPWTRHPGLSQAPRPGACQRHHGDTLGSWWTERSLASTAMRKVMGREAVLRPLPARPASSALPTQSVGVGSRRAALEGRPAARMPPMHMGRIVVCKGRLQFRAQTEPELQVVLYPGSTQAIPPELDRQRCGRARGRRSRIRCPQDSA